MGEAGKRGCFGLESKEKDKINRKKSEMTQVEMGAVITLL